MHKTFLVVFVLAFFICANVVRAQSLRVDARNMGERVIAVVPLVGAGTYADPQRPLFAPVSEAERQNPDGIHSFTWQPADDGRHAIVEFIARNRDAFRALLADKRVVRVFEKGKASKEDIERELRSFQKAYRFDKDQAFRRAQ